MKRLLHKLTAKWDNVNGLPDRPQECLIGLISGIPTGHDSLETLVRISAGNFLFSNDAAAG